MRQQAERIPDANRRRQLFSGRRTKDLQLSGHCLIRQPPGHSANRSETETGEAMFPAPHQSEPKLPRVIQSPSLASSHYETRSQEANYDHNMAQSIL